jgi:hypothetical protein
MAGAISKMDDNEMWLVHRQHLIQVYPWNTTDCYRCAVVSSIAGTFDQYILRDSSGNLYRDYNSEIAVIDFILKNHVCTSGNDTSWLETRRSVREEQRRIWADTVKDSLKTPLDTSAVSLKDIGLGFLLSAPEQHGSASQAIRTFYVVDNPFDRDPVVRYSLEGSEVAQLEVFDILGNRLWASTPEVVGRDEKEAAIPLPTAEKYYYVRLSTASGAVRTLRVVRK